MTTYTPDFEPSSGVVITVKGGLKQHQRRLTWSQDKLKMRVDLVFSQTGELTQNWVIFHGNNLCAFDRQFPQEILGAVANLEMGMTPDEAAQLVSGWEEAVLRNVVDYSRPGKAWVKAYQLQNS